MANLTSLPDDLPVPEDDGAVDHLLNSLLPSTFLTSTSDQEINLTDFSDLFVLYIYPLTGHPDIALPEGWNEIPGARGCTPQSCAFRDHHKELLELGCEVLGLSTQTTEYQKEAKARLHLPFDLISDHTLTLKHEIQIPTFIANEMELYKRLTLIIFKGEIVKVFYPVFPPDKNADNVIAWLNENAGQLNK